MRRSTVAFALALVAALGLTGCGLLDGPGPLQPRSTATGTPAPDAAATDGPATDAPVEDAELDAFSAALEGQGVDDPEALVAAVEAAGFDRSTIERTRHLDSLGAPVTFVEVAVRQDDSCLLGQVGDGEPMAVRTSLLPEGRCLIGADTAP